MKDILKIIVSLDGRTVGTGIRISRKHCIEIIEEIESVCNTEFEIFPIFAGGFRQLLNGDDVHVEKGLKAEVNYEISR